MWITYLIILALLIIAELVYFHIADKCNIIDKPNERSSHTKVVLRGGGIIFVISIIAWMAFQMVHGEWLMIQGYLPFIVGLVLIAVVSFWDDIHSLPDSVRLVAQFAAMFLMFYQMGILQWDLWWVVLIAWIVCVGIINAYNFMDGINGITGGYSLAVLLPLAYLNMQEGFISMSLLICVILADLVFCFFNFRKKAKCFAGDVGSVSMAFIVVFAIGMLMVQTNDFSWIMLLAVYGVDTVLTICHRILLHEHLGEAHRKHAYQIMANELKIPHVVVSTFYMGLQLLIAAGLIFLPINHYLYSVIVLVILSVAYLVFMKKNYYLHEEYLKSLRS